MGVPPGCRSGEHLRTQIKGRLCAWPRLIPSGRLILALLLLHFAAVALALTAETGTPSPPIPLTPEERAWLDAGHRVRVRITDWPPYMMTEPVPSGVAVDYLDDIAKRFNFKIEFVTTPLQWAEAMADVGGPRAHFDLLPTMNRTPEREQAFALTDDYLTAPWVVYTRNDTPYIAGLEGLGGQVLAAEKGYVITDRIRADYPAIRILEVGRSREALEAVATRQADAYVGNLAIANYLIKAYRFSNLVVAAATPYGLHNQAMGVRKDWAPLASLINKGLAAMSHAQIDAINQKWGAVEVRPQGDYRLVWQILAGATLVFIVFFLWNRRLAREVAVRQRIAADLMRSEARLSEEKHHLEQARQDLLHLNQTLEIKVTQRTAELEAANQAKSAFLANMSHEIRTPMNAIIGFAQVLVRDPELTASQREGLAIIQRSGDHLLTLINDILDMAKIEAGRMTLRVAPFDPARLLTETEAFFRQRARDRGLDLILALPTLPHRVVGDEMKLRQVLINLVGNAVKFTTAGRVTLQAVPLEAAIRFSIHDTGPGIDRSEMARLFQPFSQTTTGQLKPGGTGLGLALSSQFVRLMGGELTADSTPGQGSCFTFTLPLPPADEAAARDPVPLPPILGLEPGQPVRRLLIVDDLPDNRAPLRGLLASLNPQPPVLEFREAADGREAVAIWEAWQPHVILMDMRMPVMTGEEATRQIKARMAARPDAERTLIVALTASAFNGNRDHFLACGCDEFAGKPFRAEELFAIMERRVGLRFRRAEAAPMADAPLLLDDMASRLAACPAAWRADLRKAVDLGDFERITDLLAQPGATDAALQAALTPLAYNYDLEALSALFSSAEAGALTPPQAPLDHPDAEGPAFREGSQAVPPHSPTILPPMAPARPPGGAH